MKERFSGGPVVKITGLPLKRKTLFLLLPPLLTALFLYLPYPGLNELRYSWYGIEITDRSGEILYHIPGKEGSFMRKRSCDELPARVKEIFIRLEDKRFYAHPGIDLLAVFRAFGLNLIRFRVVSGASTITMQLARIISALRGETRISGFILGKLKGSLCALRIESKLTKEEILQLYLNHLPFGYNTSGVEAASHLYFNRTLETLTKAQILLLACIPKAPALYDPFKYPERLRIKASSISRLIAVSEKEIDEALATVERGEPFIKAPHFISYIMEETLPDLEQMEIARIVTTLNYGLYRTVLMRMRSLLDRNSDSNLTNASVLLLDNREGEVLVWIGSRNYFDLENSGHIDGVLVQNQSGSTLKPFFYALALEGDYSPASLLPDIPLVFGAVETYRPENFDRRNRGLVRLRTALGSSLNVPAVYLLSQIRLDSLLKVCPDLGFSLPSDARERYGLGAAIGNVEVSLYELTRAFSVFPNQGLLFQPISIKAVKTVKGDLIHLQPGDDPSSRADSAKRIYSQEISWLIWDILSDPSARASGFGTQSIFNTRFKAMFKSGTAGEYANLWCLGATEEYTMGVWAGNFDGKAAIGTTGSSIPASVIVQTFKSLVEKGGGSSRTKELRPEGVFPMKICTLTGMRASATCSSTRIEYFQAGKVPGESCPVHHGGETAEGLLLEIFLGPGKEKRPRILFPLNGSVFYLDRGIRDEVQRIQCWIAAQPQESLKVSLNGRNFILSYPFTLDVPVQPGTYTLRIKGEAGVDEVNYFVK